MSKRADRANIIELGGDPRINFLPAEIQQRKDARRRRRSLFMLVILVGVLCGIGYVYSAQFATERQAALETEQQTTLDLLAQQGQFAEARSLANQVTMVGKAIGHASTYEVPWRDLILDLEQALPTGVDLNQWAIKGPTVFDVPQANDALFPVVQFAQVDLDVFATDLISLSVALDALAERPGVISVEILSASQLEDSTSYGAIITVRFSDEALSGRFSGGWQPGMTPIAPTTPPEAPEQPADDGDDAPTDGTEEGDQ